jgi:hypothetical protein
VFLDGVWFYLVVGYMLTVAVELPILVVGLGPEHTLRRKMLAGFWLTACTYPMVVLVLPPLFWSPSWGSRWLYLAVAEPFAALAECGLFLAAFDRLSRRDAVSIVLANLSSFAVGEVLRGLGRW